MSADLAQIMERYCNGEAAAFRELYAAVSPRLFGYLMRLSGERSTAEDLLQQTFLKVHRARRAYVRGAAPLPWMYAIAHRTFLDEARRRKRSRVKLASDGDGVPERAAGIRGGPAEQVEDGPDPDLTRAAMAALDRLPASQRQAVVLVKLGGKSIAEAARIAGTTPGAMKVRAHRGYVALRKALEAGGGEA